MKDSYLQSLLGENENIILVTHRHWLVLVGEIITEIILSVALFVLTMTSLHPPALHKTK